MSWREIFVMPEGAETGEKDLWIIRVTLYFFGALGAGFVLLYSLYGASVAEDVPNFWARAAAFLGIAGVFGCVGFAAFCGGGVLGFLFGIPKSISNVEKKSNDLDQDAETQRYFKTNTNLEEMSDWLTKIIIGAGLVGLKDIARYFERSVKEITASLGPVPFGSVVVGAVLIAFLLLGFLTAYLLVRLFLTGAFARAELLSFVKRQETANLNFTSFTDAEKDALSKVLKASSKGYTLPATFQRNKEEHNAFRSLKERLIVKVKEGGKFDPNKTVMLTQLAGQLKGKLQGVVKTSGRD